MWEKFKEKVESQLRETTGIKEFILSKARVRWESMGEMTCIYPRMCGFVDVFFFLDGSLWPSCSVFPPHFLSKQNCMHEQGDVVC